MTLLERVKTWRRALHAAGWEVMSGEMTLAAAGCAFYATLALFPAMTTLISLYGLAFNPKTIEPQLLYLKHFMPPEAYQLIAGRITALVSSGKTSLGIGLVISLTIALYSSASSTKSLIYAMNIIHKKEETRGIIHFQLISLGLTLVAILGAILAIAVLVVLPLALSFLGLHGAAQTLALVLSFAVMVVFMAGSLALVYHFGPAFKRPGRKGRHHIAEGALVAILLWLLVSYLFAVYVAEFAAYSRTYGPLATIVGLMMWFYVTAYVLLFGALLNAGLDRESTPEAVASAP